MSVTNPSIIVPITVEVLAPVHIGDGGKLVRDIDFVVRDGFTYVLHIDRFARWAYEAQRDERWMSLTPGQILAGYKTEDVDVFRYRMRGTPEKNELRTFEKNGYGLPYLPGSSLKGMLRTIFLWGLYAARGKQPDLSKLGRSRSFAGQLIERDVIGSDPNRDLFRAVHVRDSKTITADDLRVVSADVFPTSRQGKGGVVVACEAAPEGMTFQSSMTIDSYGFSEHAAAELGWKGKESWLSAETIAQLGQAFSEQRLRQELDFYKDREDGKFVLGFYRTVLLDRFKNQQANQFLAQIGWGTGWNSKTFNDLLLADEKRFAEIVRRYRMTRFPDRFTPGTRFPKSRQLFRNQGRSVRPMGWVQVTLG